MALIAVTALANIGALANGAIIVVETGNAETLNIGNGGTSHFTMIERADMEKPCCIF